jgi:methylenetetrahydrofolate dehydrogenase (NADP+)/methenyltetrahydrofolate cyclohydrolase
MMLSGRELAAEIRSGNAAAAAELTAAGRQPRLAVVTATDDEASAWYVRQIASASAKAGIACDVTDLTGLKPDAGQIEEALAGLSKDPGVHGIMLQTPLPGGARLAELAGVIDPAKDVDGANPVSLGRLMTGLPAFAPATAAAVLLLLDHYQVPLEGRHAVVVGRSEGFKVRGKKSKCKHEVKKESEAFTPY